MEANPGSGPLGPAPGRMQANPMATFTGPPKPAITTPSKGFQQPAKKAPVRRVKSLLSSKMKGLGKAGKGATQKVLARKAKQLKKKGKK